MKRNASVRQERSSNSATRWRTSGEKPYQMAPATTEYDDGRGTIEQLMSETLKPANSSHGVSNDADRNRPLKQNSSEPAISCRRGTLLILTQLNVPELDGPLIQDMLARTSRNRSLAPRDQAIRRLHKLAHRPDRMRRVDEDAIRLPKRAGRGAFRRPRLPSLYTQSPKSEDVPKLARIPLSPMTAVDGHRDWRAPQFLSKSVEVGAVGWSKIRSPVLAGSASSGTFQSSVIGVGPQVGLPFPVAAMALVPCSVRASPGR